MATSGCGTARSHVESANQSVRVTLEGDWNLYAATANLAIGLDPMGSPDPDDPVIGVATNIETGLQADLIAPEDKEFPYLVVQRALGIDDALLMSGVRCRSFQLDESVPCGSPVSYRWDENGSWTELDVPAGLEHVRGIFTDFSNGDVYAIAQQVEPQPTALLALADDSWTIVGSFTTSDNVTACIAGRSVYSLAKHQASAAPGQETVEVTVETLDLASKTAHSLGVPPLRGKYGGSGVYLGCTQEGPVIATQTADRGPVEVYRRVSEQWVVVTPPLADGEPALLSQSIDTPAGVMLSYVRGSGTHPSTSKVANFLLVGASQATTSKENLLDLQPVLMGLSPKICLIPIGNLAGTPLSTIDLE